MLRKKKADEAAAALAEEKKVKIKWFKVPEIRELAEAIEKNTIKVKKNVNLKKLKCIRIDHVTVTITDNDVIYTLEEGTNNTYMSEWKQGPGRWLRKDIKRPIHDGSDYSQYIEVCYPTKEGFVKKALIRLLKEFNFDCTEEETRNYKKDLEDNNLLHGMFGHYRYTIIKIVGANEEYSKREIITKDIEALDELATTDFEDYQPEEEAIQETSIPLF